MHPNQFKARLFASMASGPLVAFAPEDDTGGGEDAGEGAGEEAGGAEGAGEEGAEGAGGEAEAGAEGGEEEAPKPARVPWQTKRIDKLTAEKNALAEERDRLARERDEDRRRIAAMEALYGKQGNEGDGKIEPPVIPPKKEGGERTYTQAEVEEQVSRRAALQTLNQQLDTMYETGKKAHGQDFEKRVADAGRAFPDLAARVDFFKAIAKLPNGTDVYHSLTGDLDRMGEVLDMSPLDLGMELARMSQEAASKPGGPRVSKAPAPIDVVEGRGAGAGKGSPMDEHAADFARRRKEREERRGY